MGIQLGSAYGKIELDASGVLRGVQQANSALSGMRGAMQNAFSAAAGFLVANVFQRAVEGAFGAVKAGIGIVTDYRSAMNMMQAVSGATAEQMAKVGQLAEELGADMSLPATSAGDAAKAMTELSKAGLSVDETLAAARGTLQLAAAGQISEAAAAEIAANAINAWRNAEGDAALKGTDATRVADLLAAAANSSSGEVTDMADSLKMASAVFAAAGVPIEDTVAMIGEMANQSIQGSDAGTSLKQMLLSLQAPSGKAKGLMQGMGVEIYDSQGKMLGFRDIIGNFNKSLTGLTEEQRNQALATIFGSDAVRAANVVLMGGVEAFDKMKGAVTKEGAAADIAAARSKGLGGAIDGLKSQVETAMLALFKPMELPLEEAVRGIAGMIGGGEFMGQIGAIGGQIGKALAGGLTGAANFAKTLPAMIGKAAGLVTPILGTLRDTIVGVLSSPEMEAAGSMVGAGLKVFADWATSAWPIVSVTIQEVIRRIGELIQGSLLPTFTEVVAKVGAFFSANEPLINRFMVTVGATLANLVSLIQSVWPIIDALIGGLVDAILGIGKAMMTMCTGDWAGAQEIMRNTVMGAFGAIRNAFVAFLNWVAGWFGSSWAEITKTWGANWDMFKQIVEIVWGQIETWIAVTLMNIGLKVEGELTKIRNKFDEVMGSIKEKVEGIKGALDKFVKFIQEKVTDPLLAFVTNVLKPIHSGFKDIIGAAQFLIGVVGELVASLKKVKLPDPFNPGSPTPFELGLRGISAAMEKLAGVSVPDVVGSLGALGGMTPALASAGSATGYYDYRNYFSSPVSVTAQVSNEIDMDVLAYRVASMIRSKQG